MAMMRNSGSSFSGLDVDSVGFSKSLQVEYTGIGFEGEFGSQDTSQMTRRRLPGTLRESKVKKGGVGVDPR